MQDAAQDVRCDHQNWHESNALLAIKLSNSIAEKLVVQNCVHFLCASSRMNAEVIAFT